MPGNTATRAAKPATRVVACDCQVGPRALLYGQYKPDAQIHVPQQVRREPTDPLGQ